MTAVHAGIILVASLAGAGGDRGRVGVAPFQGHGARGAQSQVSDILEDNPELKLVDVSAGDTRAACAEAGAAVLLRGEVRHKGEVALTAVDCASATPIDSFTVRLTPRKKLRSAIAKHVRLWLTAPPPAAAPEPPAPAPAAPETPPVAVAAAAEPPAAEPAPAPPVQPRRTRSESLPESSSTVTPAPESHPERSDDASTVEASVSAPRGTRATFLEASVGGGTVSRWLSYNQDLFGQMSTYSLGAGPLLVGSVEAYPFAAMGSGPLAHVGIVGQIQHSVGVSSGSTAGTAFPTTEALYAGGLRVRFWPGASEIGISAGGGIEGYDLSAAGGTTPALPNYDYTFAAASGDARVPLGSAVSVLGRVGYMQVLSNSLAQTGYFPHATAGGVDAQIGPAVALSDFFELRLNGEYRRYFFSMNPRPGEAHIAGGALDEYLCVTLQGAARFR